MIYLGCHVSMKAPSYLEGSIQDALSYGANAAMTYTGAPQNSRRMPLEKLKIDQARALMAQANFDPSRLIIHAPYIINLANSVKPETAQFGIEFLQEELKRTAAIGSTILVLHPGAHMKAGTDVGIEWIVKGLNEVLAQDDSPVTIALETMAGKGTEVGRTFEELAAIRSKLARPERVGICLDTCHIHDAGYDLTNFDQVLEEFDSILGLENLKVIHINDSKNVRGAHKDRHENIGKGEIGYEALRYVVQHPKLEAITKILETPVVDGNPPYKEEIAMLKKIDA